MGLFYIGFSRQLMQAQPMLAIAIDIVMFVFVMLRNANFILIRFSSEETVREVVEGGGKPASVTEKLNEDTVENTTAESTIEQVLISEQTHLEGR